jgi:hypothetical protein
VTRWFILLCFGWAWVGTVLLGSGAVFPSADSTTVRIPAQRALIYYADGRQTLVVETALDGPGTNFAWVIPLPAVPVIEEVSSGLFPTLSHIFQPHVIVRIRPWWLYLCVLGLAVGALLALYRHHRTWAVLASATVLVVAVLTGVLARSPTPGTNIDVGLFNDTVRQLSRHQASVYEVAVFEAPSDYALLTWLALNDFHTPTNTATALADYAREGWIFVALKARTGTQPNGTMALPPVSFTFATPHPVFPLRLTTPDQGPRQLDLFVFGHGRASASGLPTRRCSQLQPPTAREEPAPVLSGGRLRLRHPEVRALAGDASFATWLQGTLPPDRVRNDLRIHWTDRERRGEKLHTQAAAFQLAANVVAFCLAGCGLIVIGLRHRLPRGQSLQTTVSRLLFAVAGMGLMTYWMTPKIVDDRLTVRRLSSNAAAEQTQQVASALQSAIQNRENHGKPPPVDSRTEADLLRAILDSDVNHPLRIRSHLNLFSGERLRLEASPGNLSLAPNESGWVLRWHDFDGAPSPIGAQVVVPEPQDRRSGINQ